MNNSFTTIQRVPPPFLVLLPTSILEITFALVCMRQTEILAPHTYARKFNFKIEFCHFVRGDGNISNGLILVIRNKQIARRHLHKDLRH